MPVGTKKILAILKNQCPILEKAVFPCGCFWSKEYLFSQQDGVVATRVGYTGGHTERPTYQQLIDYMNRQHQQKASLVIFEYRTKKKWRQKTIQQDGKDIFVVWI